MLNLFLLAEKNKVRSSNITLVLSAGVRALCEGCRLGGFPKEIKGFSGQPVIAARIFLGDYGYSMGTLNSQTHFKIGDASL